MGRLGVIVAISLLPFFDQLALAADGGCALIAAEARVAGIIPDPGGGVGGERSVVDIRDAARAAAVSREVVAFLAERRRFGRDFTDSVVEVGALKHDLRPLNTDTMKPSTTDGEGMTMKLRNGSSIQWRVLLEPTGGFRGVRAVFRDKDKVVARAEVIDPEVGFEVNGIVRYVGEANYRPSEGNAGGGRVSVVLEGGGAGEPSVLMRAPLLLAVAREAGRYVADPAQVNAPQSVIERRNPPKVIGELAAKYVGARGLMEKPSPDRIGDYKIAMIEVQHEPAFWQVSTDSRYNAIPSNATVRVRLRQLLGRHEETMKLRKGFVDSVRAQAQQFLAANPQTESVRVEVREVGDVNLQKFFEREGFTIEKQVAIGAPPHFNLVLQR